MKTRLDLNRVMPFIASQVSQFHRFIYEFFRLQVLKVISKSSDKMKRRKKKYPLRFNGSFLFTSEEIIDKAAIDRVIFRSGPWPGFLKDIRSAKWKGMDPAN